MAVDPRKALVPREPQGMVRVPAAEGFSGGLFCASPTVLEAINTVLQQQGLQTLWVQPDGTIGPSDMLVLKVEYIPSPFVY